jgi:hypothetical protein
LLGREDHLLGRGNHIRLSANAPGRSPTVQPAGNLVLPWLPVAILQKLLQGTRTPDSTG